MGPVSKGAARIGANRFLLVLLSASDPHVGDKREYSDHFLHYPLLVMIDGTKI